MCCKISLNFSYFDSQSGVFKMSVYSNPVIHWPKLLTLLSRMSLFQTLSLQGLFAQCKCSFIKIELWSLAPTGGSWIISKLRSLLLVRHQSKIEFSLVGTLIIWRKPVNCFILLALKPVLVGLKSPVIMINASGCLERKWSTFEYVYIIQNSRQRWKMYYGI